MNKKTRQGDIMVIDLDNEILNIYIHTIAGQLIDIE